MNRPTALLLLLAGMGSAAAVGYAAYKTRRQWIGRLLHLPPARFEVGVERHVRVPMPDGITLEAERYYPKTRGSFPTILIRTPYGLSSDQPKFNDLIRNFPVQRLVERGYHVVVQSVRGRYGSGGKFIPFSRNVPMAAPRSNGLRSNRGSMARSACSVAVIRGMCSGR